MKTLFSVILVLASFLFSQDLAAQEKCVCPTCNGEGLNPIADLYRACDFCTDGYNICNTCKGVGQEPCYRCNESGIAQLPCRECNGNGKINGENCGVCGGDGIEEMTCANCEGKGSYNCHSCGQLGKFLCTMCGGEGGKLWKGPCPECNGSGQIICP
jgi:DnaJ-class molecular chaperone